MINALSEYDGKKEVEVDRCRSGKAHPNSEGGSIKTADLLVLTGKERVVLKMKKISQVILIQMIHNW